MPKTFDLQELKMNTEGSNQKDYFLFLLGTDTKFTPKPTSTLSDDELKAYNPDEKDLSKIKRYYQNGETLSYVAKVVSNLLKEDCVQNTIAPHSYSSESVDLLDGPTTLGSEVGDRIARAVFLSLHAIVSGGKTNINLFAHSRGAVESILVAHELDRIKKESRKNEKKSLYEILLGTTCTYTKTAFTDLFNSQTAELDLQELSKRIEASTINLFLMDPVPGGRFFGLPGTRWEDDRFYKRIPCKTVEKIICLHERSGCFKAIISEGVNVTLLPGHHGTLSGNLFTQTYGDLPDNLKNKDISTAQSLAVFKILMFMKNNTSLFEKNEISCDLGHQTLDNVTKEFLDNHNDLQKLQNAYINKYNAVFNNMDAFKYFVNTSYNHLALGKESSPKGGRLVHYKNSNSVGIETIELPIDSTFVNMEHALIYLKSIGLDIRDNLSVDIPVLINSLKGGLQQLFTDNKALFDNKKTEEMIFNAVTSAVKEISHIYLRNHLNKEDKKKILESIKGVIESLGTNQNNLNQQALLATIKQGIQNTAESHWFGLITQAQTLYETSLLQSDKHLEESVNRFSTLVDKADLNDNTFKQSIGLLKSIEAKNIPTKLKEILEKNPSDHERISRFLDKDQSGLSLCLEARSIKASEALKQMDTLYEDLESALVIREIMSDIIKPMPLKFPEAELRQGQVLIRDMAADLIKNNEDIRKLNHQTLSIRKEFHEVINKYAIAKGMEHQELLECEAKIKKQEKDLLDNAEVIKKKQELIQGCEKKNDALKQELADLEARHEALSKQLLVHNATENELKETIVSLNTPKEQNAGRMIQDKLLPLTEKYLLNLFNKAIAMNSLLDKDSSPFGGLNNDYYIEIKMEYLKIKTKYDHVLELYKALTNSDEIPLPSERITRFTEKLNAHKNDIQLHRDPDWVWYVKNVAIVLGIVMTGVIPGAAALLAYACFNGESPLFFAKSDGKRFVEKTEYALESSANAASI